MKLSRTDFDVLAIDAFTSDAIPVHLLTREAFQLYWRHLKPNGVLAVHVTNTYVKLAPIVARAAEQSGKFARMISIVGDDNGVVDRSDWVLVTSSPEVFSGLLSEARPFAAGSRSWTDDYSNLWQALN